MIGLAGLLAFLLLHLVLVWRWSWFAAAPWPGYEQATARGLVEPWFVHTPRSLWLTRATLFLLSAGIALEWQGSRIEAMLALWLGAALGVVFCYATTSLPSLEWGILGYFLYPLRIGLPVLIGSAAGSLFARWLEKRHVEAAA